MAGTYQLHVSLDGTPIKDSPVPFIFNPGELYAFASGISCDATPRITLPSLWVPDGVILGSGERYITGMTNRGIEGV